MFKSGILISSTLNSQSFKRSRINETVLVKFGEEKNGEKIANTYIVEGARRRTLRGDNGRCHRSHQRHMCPSRVETEAEDSNSARHNSRQSSIQADGGVRKPQT